MASLGPDAIARELEKVGVHVRLAWVESCAAHLLAAEPGFGSMPLRRRVDLCYLQFLHADMNSAGSGCLAPGDADGDPAKDGDLSRVLGGRRVVQCDEVANVSASFNDRYKDQPACEKRVLKLLITDGPNKMVAYEYRPINDLAVSMPAGTKLALTKTPVDKNGALRLSPENVAVLGGGVAHLEEARARVVDRWKLPNRPTPGNAGNANAAGAGNRRAELRRAAWGRDAFGSAAAAGTGTGTGTGTEPGPATDPARPTDAPSAAPVPVAEQPADLAGHEDPDSQVVDLTGEKEESGPASANPAEVPPGRVKRKRAVVIDDSDDDPTPVRRKPTQTHATQETASRLARATPRGADEARDRDRDRDPVVLEAARETATRLSDSVSAKPPQWASRVVRSEPFAYAAAVRAMRAAGVRGQTPSEANVTLHGWFLRVSSARPAAGGGFEIAASVHDGTGSLECVVPAAMTLKLVDVPSASAFDAMDEGSRARLQTWAVTYLRGFLGKVTLRVRTFDDQTPARVLKVFGPRDFHDAATTSRLGRRCDGIDKELKRLKQTEHLEAKHSSRGEETRVASSGLNPGGGEEKGASGGAGKAPSRLRTSTGAKVARGA
jgi:hypothetical protein